MPSWPATLNLKLARAIPCPAAAVRRQARKPLKFKRDSYFRKGSRGEGRSRPGIARLLTRRTPQCNMARVRQSKPGDLSGSVGCFEDHDFLATACRAFEHKLVLAATLRLDQRQPHSRFALWTGSVQQRIVPPRRQLAVLQLTLPSTPSPALRRTVDTGESELERWPARVSIRRGNYQQENSTGHSEKF